MSKRILREIRIDEISAVDRPAQKGARALLMKSENDLAKTAFSEALTELTLQDSVMEACEELWNLDQALRLSVQEILNNKDKYPDPKTALRESLGAFATAVASMVANVGADVYNKAQSPKQRACVAAKSAEWKKQNPGKNLTQETIKAHVEECARVVAKAEKTDGGEQYPASDYAYVPDAEMPSTWKLRLTSTPGGEPDSRIVGAAVAALGDGFRGQPVQLPEEDRAAVVSKVRAAWTKLHPDAAESDVPEVLKSSVEDDEMAKTIEQLERELALAKSFGTLTDAEKAYCNSLPENEQASFLAKSTDERHDVLAKRDAADPVVYTAADGTAFRKSDDVRLVSMAKRADAAEVAAKTATAAAVEADLAKRADALQNLPGTPEVRMALLRSVDAIQDETLRKSALEALQAQNRDMAKAFETRGIGGGKSVDGPAAKLDEMAKSLAKEKSLSFAVAQAEILKTDEGRRLYAQTVAG